MFALIYDEFDPEKRDKRVISIHKRRETAEKALKNWEYKLGRRVWECHTRIVWAHDPVYKGESITPDSFDTWAPGEEIPPRGIGFRMGIKWGFSVLGKIVSFTCLSSMDSS